MTRPAPGHPLLTRRSSGVLLHRTSLPGRHGSGDLGVAARHFVDWLALAGQTLWQILPLTPPGAGQSWGEIRDWEKACDWLEKALTSDRGECPMRALEQYANYRVRLAADHWHEARRLPAA